MIDAWEDTARRLTRITEAAALAAWPFRGRDQGDAADAAAARAMRAVLTRWGAPIRVLSGEGEKDGVHHLAGGEQFGATGPAALGCELAVDPIDGTSRLNTGRNGALAAAALVPAGGCFDPGPSHYMSKIVCSARAAAVVDPEADPIAIALAVARALDKPLAELCVFVLDKPRHVELISRLQAAGARVARHDAGDLEGALLAALPDSGIDLLLGTGGTPEGMVSACGVRALGGTFFGRLAPQRAPEREALHARGLHPGPWLRAEQLVPGDRFACCVTGITPCTLVAGVHAQPGELTTASALFWGPGRHRMRVQRTYCQAP